jgi:uncharacterized protein
MTDTPEPIQIFLDADACPVKEEAYRVGERHGVVVHVVANSGFRVPQSPLIQRVIVDGGFDAADHWIAERATTSSIVVTADIPLAARCLESRAEVLNHNGQPFTHSAIGMALAMRGLMQDLRAMGEAGGGNKPFAPRDRSRFLEALERSIARLKRAGFTTGQIT